MQNKTLFLKSIIFSLIIGFLSSCATHHGYLSSNAVIVDNNFRIIGIGVGEAESVKVLGLGGFQKDALVFDAKNDLYNKVALKQGQALTNITVDFKNEFYIFFSKTKVTLTAEIVDFNPNSDNITENDYGVNERNGYRVGEMIYLKINGEYEKKKIERLNLKELQITSSKPESKELVDVKYDDAFKLTGSFEYMNSVYTIGDSLCVVKVGAVNPSVSQEVSERNGIVVGVSENHALLIDTENREFFVVGIQKK